MPPLWESGPCVVLHLRAPNTPSGNPNRLYVVIDKGGAVMDMVDEGYTGLPRKYAGIPVYQIEVTAKEIRGWKEDYGGEFRKNPTITCDVCGVSVEAGERLHPCRFESGCSCWRGVPCSKRPRGMARNPATLRGRRLRNLRIREALAKTGNGVTGILRAKGFTKRQANRLAARLGPMKKNPPLVTFANPPEEDDLSGEERDVMSRNVVEIRYQHAEDGKFYKHRFKRGQVVLIAKSGGKAAVMIRTDGKPLVEDY